MSIIDTLITDRSAADLSSLRTLLNKAMAKTITAEEWAQLVSPDHKGAYNASDLNRVNTAMEYLVARLRGYGYSAAGYISEGKLWAETDIPSQTDMQRYTANVAAIRAALAMLPTTPEAPADMAGLTISEANAMEKILVDCETVINAMVTVMPRAGQLLLFCGHAVYVSHPKNAEPATYLSVYTADGLAVYTADGLAVQVIG